MKTISYISILFLTLLLSGCSESFDEMQSSDNTITLSLNMPGADNDKDASSVNRIRLSAKDKSLDLLAQWQEGDEVQIIFRQGTEIFRNANKKVESISEDNKRATVNISLPVRLDPEKPYTIYGFTGIEGDVEKDDGVAHCYVNLRREALKDFKAPMWFQVEMQGANACPAINFKHIGTYEVLHLKNSTNKSITFVHSGFTANTPWYRWTTGVFFDDNWDFTKLQTSEWEGEEESKSISIAKNSTADILTYYIPSGFKLKDAKINAKIDGKNVSSTNTLSSDASIALGRAYHMYAEWDGTELKFNKSEEDPDTHEYVDLGLPSGTLWATCNVGASKPEEYGDHFAWGETKPKTDYSWSTYKWGNDYEQLTKYCTSSSYGLNGFTDNKTTLDLADDAARANWGDQWRMPTIAEFEELVNNTSCEWVTNYKGTGVNGRLFTANNGKRIFLPAAGDRKGTSLRDVGSEGYYWSSSLATPESSYAGHIGFSSSGGSVVYDDGGRFFGFTVRPVRTPASENHEYVDLGLPSGTLWATCNVGASSPEEYGDYFAWGETEPKSDYSWSTYKWGIAYNQLTKYCNYSEYGKNGFTDNKTSLDLADDAAHVNWGNEWCMPTGVQLVELFENTNVTLATNYNGTGVSGYKFTNKRDVSKFIFLPFSGYRDGTLLCEEGSSGYYWSNTIIPNDTEQYTDEPYGAEGMNLDGNTACYIRYYGRTIRPVRVNSSN